MSRQKPLKLHCLCNIFIQVMNKDINWAWYAIGIACIMSAFFSYSMRVYFFNKLYKNLKGA